MQRSSLHRAQLAVPLGLVGVAGALMVGDFYGMTLHREGDGDARSALMFLTPIVGLLLGFLLSLRWIRSRAAATWLTALVGTALAGTLIGIEASHLRYPGFTPSHAIEIGALSGASMSLAFFPVVLAVALLGRRVGRARAGSVVDEQDVRRVFGIVAFATAVGAPLVTLAGDRAYSFSVGTSGALGGVATIVLSTLVILDVISFVRVRRAVFAVVDMRPAQPGAIDVEDVVDVGLGDDAYEKLADAGGAYRTNQHPVSAIIGEPSVALAAIRGGLVQSGAMVIAAIIAGLVNLYTTTSY